MKNKSGQSGTDNTIITGGKFSYPRTNMLVNLPAGDEPHKVYCGNTNNRVLLTSGQVKCWGGGGPGVGATFTSRTGRKGTEFRLQNNIASEWAGVQGTADDVGKYEGDLCRLH